MMWWNNGTDWGGMGWGGMGAGTWVVMSLLMLAFWALVVFGVIALFRSGKTSDSDGGAPSSPPQQLLDDRFARGEIDAEEDQARKGLLHSRH